MIKMLGLFERRAIALNSILFFQPQSDLSGKLRVLRLTFEL